MKKAFFTLTVACLLSSATHAEDVYDYRQTPVPNQIADLLDDDKDGVINARDLCPDTPLCLLYTSDAADDP